MLFSLVFQMGQCHGGGYCFIAPALLHKRALLSVTAKTPLWSTTKLPAAYQLRPSSSYLACCGILHVNLITRSIVDMTATLWQQGGRSETEGCCQAEKSSGNLMSFCSSEPAEFKGADWTHHLLHLRAQERRFYSLCFIIVQVSSTKISFFSSTLSFHWIIKPLFWIASHLLLFYTRQFQHYHALQQL